VGSESDMGNLSECLLEQERNACSRFLAPFKPLVMAGNKTFVKSSDLF